MVGENRIEQGFAAHAVDNIKQYSIVDLESGVTMLNNIVDNLEQQSIVQCCSHQS